MENTVMAEENVQVIDHLYEYLKQISLGVLWSFEYPSEEIPSIYVKQNKMTQKIKSDIIGGYEAELSFSVCHQARVGTIEERKEITRPLNSLTTYLEEESRTNFPNLTMPKGIVPIKLEVITTPYDTVGKENDIAIFAAMYKLTYKKKAR